MSKLSEMIARLCPNGVEYKKIKDAYTRLRGTPITATQMKAIGRKDGEIRIFAGGKTVVDAREEDIPNANITRVPAVLVQSRGVIDFVFYDKPFTFKNEMWAYTAKEEISVKYLYYVLQNSAEHFREAASGMGAFPQISLKVTEDFLIPLPPLPIQREIVQYLDNFANLTAELTAELAKRKKQYEHYRDSLFSFGDDIPRIEIGNLTKVFSAARVHKNEWKKEGVPFYRSSDVTSWHNHIENPRGKVFISHELFEKLSAKSGKFHEGDVFVTGGGSIGLPYILPFEGPFYVKDADLICIQKTDRFESKFLFYYFMSTEFRDYLNTVSHGATIAHYTISQVEKTLVPLPPIAEQRRIITLLDRFDALCNSLTEGLPAEIALRKKQYEYYRDKLLSFKEAS